MVKCAFILAFSGHRRLPNKNKLDEAIRQVLIEYRRVAESLNGELHLNCMVAWGADLIAIEQAEQLKIPVHLILPKEFIPGSDGKKIEGLAEDFIDPTTGIFREEDWRRGLNAIKNAQAGMNGGSLRTFPQLSSSAEVYYDTSVHMLSAADGLLVIWDGTPAKGPGGTAETHDHAQSLGLPIWVVSPDTTIDTLKRPSTELLKTDGADIAHPLLTQSHGSINNFFDELDIGAEKIGVFFRGKMTKTIMLHFYATLLAAFAASFVTYAPAKYLLMLFSGIQGCLVTMAWFIQRKIKKSNAHTKWLNLRFAAELVRSAQSTKGLTDSMYPSIQSYRPEWSRFIRSVTFASNRQEPASEDWKFLRDQYVAKRLNTQIEYFEKKKKEADKESASLQRFLVLATMMAPWVAALGLVYKFSDKISIGITNLIQTLGISVLPVDEFLRFLPITLPLIAGYLGSRRQASDNERRRIRYAQLAHHLREISESIQRLKTKSTTLKMIIHAEEILLSEQLEWRLRESQAYKK